MTMIINLSNHPHASWQEKQLRAAQAYGKVIDLPFPQILSTTDVESIALDLLNQIREMKPDAVLVMGEFSLVFMMVDALLDDGIPVLTAASNRSTVEKREADGRIVKVAHFDFVGFRQYRRLKKPDPKWMGITANGIAVKDRLHSHVHYEDGLTDAKIREAISRISVTCPCGKIQHDTVRFDEIVGNSSCISLTDELRKRVQWMQRPGRDGLTPMISGVPSVPVNTLFLALRRTDENEAILLTAYAGEEAFPEPWTPWLSDAEREISEAFWSTHALAFPESSLTDN
ncbi:MAG TPA: hypothetical protein DHV42_08045 [Lachnospiraceae bacterium]|jgi:hypothetical protein|nr:hypothetical protein [Lachnospiraceae bacterium]